uniref:Uncharacterized protein n=1 Tax=Anguilla anguilla TaxID=7936 RepID=A0A0E9WV03_ANGAN
MVLYRETACLFRSERHTLKLNISLKGSLKPCFYISL